MTHSQESGCQWFLAVDGGGSKVAGLIAQSNSLSSANAQTFRFSLAGVGSAGEVNWDLARRNIIAVVEQLLHQANIGAEAVAHAVFMLAGAGRPQDVRRVSAALRQAPPIAQFRRITVTSDLPLLVHAQQLEPRLANIVTIVGTGSMVAALDQNEQLIRAGGWGPTLGDQGSGWRIAQAALMRMCTWIDRGDDFVLDDDLELITAVHRFLIDKQLVTSDSRPLKAVRDELSAALLKLASDRHLAAQLAPPIIELARANENPVCKQIVTQQIVALCEQLACVHQRLQLGAQSWRLCTTGGLVCHQAHYRELLLTNLAQRGLAPKLDVVLEPLDAALTFARR